VLLLLLPPPLLTAATLPSALLAQAAGPCTGAAAAAASLLAASSRLLRVLALGLAGGLRVMRSSGSSRFRKAVKLDLAPAAAAIAWVHGFMTRRFEQPAPTAAL
jgi:hypothetical protein